MASVGRRSETVGYMNIALDLQARYNGQVIQMPENKPGEDTENAYLEGGDVFVNNTDLNITSFSLSNGLGSSEKIYFCLEEVPAAGLISQTVFSAPSS